MNKKTKTIIWIVSGVLIAVLLFLLFSDYLLGAKSIAFSQFKDLIVNGDESSSVQSISCNAFVWEMVMKNGTRYVTNAPSVHYYADWAAFVAEIEALGGSLEGITVEFSNPNSGSILDYIFPILSVGIGFILLFVLFRQMSGGRDHTMGIGKSKAHVQNNLKVRF